MRLSASDRIARRLPAALLKTLTTLPPLLPASSLLGQPQDLLACAEAGLTNPLVYLNARALGRPAFARWLHNAYAARDATHAAIQFGRYAYGSLLDGEGSFLVLTAGALVAEQVPGAGEDLHAAFASLHARARDAIHVERPCLLACRFGEWTWGHWLLDVLPKIVLAERHAPQHFTFAVPSGIVDPSFGSYARSVLESLAAYGVDPSRLLRIRPSSLYRFDALFDIAGVHGKAMHPGVLHAMRDLPVQSSRRQSLTAVLRAPPSIRCLANDASIRNLLAKRGAAFLDASSASFAHQVTAFRDSDLIVGDLGSNLAALIYARPGTGVVTLAPAGWHDEYLINLFQRLDVVLADIRGHAFPLPGQPLHHAPVMVNVADVEAGLGAVRDAMTDQTCRRTRRVDGRLIAREPGPIVAAISFGNSGNAALFQMQGFAAPEAVGTWSVGSRCRLALPVPLHDQPMWLEILGTGFVNLPHLVSRPLAVSVNGTCLAEFDTDDRVRLHVYVPAELTSTDELVVDFHHPACPSPLAMGVSPDARPLGIMFERVALRLAEAVRV